MIFRKVKSYRRHLFEMDLFVSVSVMLIAIFESSAAIPFEFCSGQYCYSSDGKLKDVSSLKDAQDYCKERDNSSWLLEIYNTEQFEATFNNIAGKGLALLNTVGSSSERWTSVSDSPLPTHFTVNETDGRDYLYLRKSGADLNFYGSNRNFAAKFICDRGNGSHEVINLKLSWYRAEVYCYTSGGHLATLGNLTREMILALNLDDSMNYWLGYSRVIYKWQHAATRAYLSYFWTTSENSPQYTSLSNETYFVYIWRRTSVTPQQWLDKPYGNESFLLVCMNDTTATTSTLVTTTEQASTILPTNQPSTFKGTTIILETTKVSRSAEAFYMSMFIPLGVWIAFSACFVFCLLPICIKRNLKRELLV